MKKLYILVVGEVPVSVIEEVRKNYIGEVINIEGLVPALMHLLGDNCSPDMIVLGDHIKMGELQLLTEELRPVFARLAKIHNRDLYLGRDNGQIVSLENFEKMRRK